MLEFYLTAKFPYFQTSCKTKFHKWQNNVLQHKYLIQMTFLKINARLHSKNA